MTRVYKSKVDTVCKHSPIERLQRIYLSEETGFAIYVDPEYTGQCHHKKDNYLVSEPLSRQQIKQYIYEQY
jgi:hypothetical protein